MKEYQISRMYLGTVSGIIVYMYPDRLGMYRYFLIRYPLLFQLVLQVFES